MIRCASVRKAGSTDQCPLRALANHTLCGRHAKCKKAVLWANVHASHGTKLVRCQALVRGWLVRQRLAMCGPGVLSRSGVVNQDDPVTLEHRDNVHPFSYFGIEENGKVFWFEFDTLYSWCIRSTVPSNPFTKVPLSQDTRKRLREGWSYRQRHKLELPPESTVFEERVLQRWTLLCQLFEDYGFGQIHPRSFLRITKSQYRTLFLLIRDDLMTAIPEAHPVRNLLLSYCTRGLHVAATLPSRLYTIQSIYTLLLMLTRQRDAYSVAFVVLSALYRC